MTEETKHKISARLKDRQRLGLNNFFKGVIKVPREERFCNNPECEKTFQVERWRKDRFCSIGCAMKVIGGRPTSPKASRGKAGIRPDISSTTYFFSRWEANIARLYTHLKVRWVFSPDTFDIGNQNYTPDFYLPEQDMYVEVKNFWNEYSRIRDGKFRKHHPNIKLKVIMGDEYLDLEQQYAHLIPTWEYKNSPVPTQT